MKTPRQMSRFMIRFTSVVILGLVLGAGCTQRNPYNPADDGAVQPDSGVRTDSGGQLDSGGQFDSGGQRDGAPAHDGSVSSCNADSQCGPTQYCAFPTGTCGKVPGTCTQRPGPGCPEYYSPVCGCDGKTYSNACFSASKGVSVQHLGACKTKQSCNQLNQSYVAAVQKAKSCSPMLPVVQCQVQVGSALHCACPIYVEQGNTKAIAELKQIKQQFTAAGCTPYLCGMPCPAAKPGNCAPDPTGGGSCH
jgi:hypothetical protein